MNVLHTHTHTHSPSPSFSHLPPRHGLLYTHTPSHPPSHANHPDCEVGRGEVGEGPGRGWGPGHQADQLPAPHPCSSHPASFAVQSCSVLTGELFAPCSAYLSPVPYFEQCRQDACRCGQPCLCATLAHYAHLCRRHGLPVDFRAHLPACGECPTQVHPQEGGPRSLSSRPTCSPAPLPPDTPHPTPLPCCPSPWPPRPATQDM